VDLKYIIELEGINIDIQYIVEGTEVIWGMPIGKLSETESYSPKKHIVFYDEINYWSKLTLNAEDFAIFFSENAHKPCCAFEKQLLVKKVVVKENYKKGDIV